MNKTRFLAAIIVALALLNVATLATLWHRPAAPRREGPRKIILERLQFDKQQAAAYDTLVVKHRTDIRRKDAEMAMARQAVYQQLQHGDFSRNDSLIAQVGQLQMDVEQIHLAHFQDIKKLCRPDQVESFNLLSAELERLFGKPQHARKQ